MKGILLMVVVVILNVLGNSLLKYGAVASSSLGLVNRYTLIAVAAFGMGFVLTAMALRVIPLYLAQVFMAVQLAGSLLVANYFFNEILNKTQWIGLGFIFIGLFIVIFHTKL